MVLVVGHAGVGGKKIMSTDTPYLSSKSYKIIPFFLGSWGAFLG